jgi:hypothetical protein
MGPWGGEFFMKTPDFFFGITDGDLIYDIETYPNLFCIGFQHDKTEQKWYFEISPTRNDIQFFVKFLSVLSVHKCRMVGFNNVGFDYPVIHMIFKFAHLGINYKEIYDKAVSIINSHGPAKFAHMVWESDHIVPQIDLYKIHHFDNMAKATSLKMLEFNMQMDNIQDLPFTPNSKLMKSEREAVAEYMWHDIKATRKFYKESLEQIKMRENLSESFGKNMVNMSDVKIGETILITEIEKAGIECYATVDGQRKKRQTIRDSINLADVIFSYVSFERSEFQNILDFLRSKVITETKGVFGELCANVDGVMYKFGTGGLHASVESQIVCSSDTHELVDVDVASFYPNLGIKNKLYPAHLGPEFCDAYLDVYHTRKKYKKGTPENNAYKLALNGAYGKSSSPYSVFFDQFYTMSITINGQLLLCMLIEQMLKVPGLKMIQANTDGITYLCPREYLEHTRNVCRWWEQLTKLELEEALYNRMFIRDVNSYMAEKKDGKLKRIGAYAHETAKENPGTREVPWHKNHSALVVPKAAEAALVRGEDIREFILNHDNIFDFFLRTKVPRNSELQWGGEKVQNIVRYYISKNGKTLQKVMPPAGPIGEYKRANKLTDSYFNSVMQEIGPSVWDERIHTKNKSKYEERVSGINTGWTVQVCNDLPPVIADPDYIDKNGQDGGDIYKYEQFRNDINLEWYVKEASKLVDPLTR